MTQQKKDISKNEVSKGTVAGKIADALLNPTNEKLREFTYITKFQAQQFPLLNTVIDGIKYAIEIAMFMENPDVYKKLARKEQRNPIPFPPNLAEELLVHTSVWQRSLGGKTQEKLAELAEAEITSMADKEGNIFDKLDREDDF